MKIEEDSSLNELSVVVDTFGNVSPLQPALVALNVIDLLINKSKLLSSSIMQHFLIPIVQNHQLTPTIKSSKGSNTLYFTDSQITQSSSHAQETKPQSTSIETLGECLF